MDTDGDLDRWNISQDVAPEVMFALNQTYAIYDAASAPYFEATFEGDEEPVTAAFDYDFLYVSPSYVLLEYDDGYLTGWGMTGQVAVAFAGTGEAPNETMGLYYYAMSRTGVLSILCIYLEEEDGEIGVSMANGTLGQITGIEFSSDPFAYSMNYLGFNSYEEFGDNAKEAILLADKTYNNIWYVDTDPDSETYLQAVFVGAVDGSTNIAAMFNNDIDALESLMDEEDGPDAFLSDKLQAFFAEKLGDEVQTAETIDLSAEAQKPANETTGSLNAVTIQAETAEPEGFETATKITVTYTEDEDVNNGFITLTFDATALTFDDLAYAAPDFYSCYLDIDEEDVGVVAFAFASANAVEAGETIATFTFFASCGDTSYTALVLERNDALDVNEETIVDLEGVPHNWAAPVWDWDENFESATAIFVCNNNDAHVEELEAAITVEEVEATCEDPAKTVYTATVEFEGKTYTDVQEVETGDPTGHSYGDPEWTWTETDNGYTATATFICANDETHVETLDAEIEMTEDATGTKTYTATVIFEDETYTDTLKTPGTTAVMNGVALTLDGQLSIDFYVIAPENAAYAVLAFEGSEQIIELDRTLDIYDAANDEFCLSFKNVPPKKMTSEFTLTVFTEDDTQLALTHFKTGPIEGDAFKYCIADWANSAIASNKSAEAVALAKAILNYGQAAQVYFSNYNLPDAPANPNGYLAEEMAALEADPANDALLPEDIADFGYAGASLVLEGDTAIQLWFSKEVTAVDENGKEYEVIQEGNEWYVNISGIAAKNLDKTFIVVVTDAAGETRAIEYSVLSYANIVLGKNSNAALVELCKALYLYNAAAKAYFPN